MTNVLIVIDSFKGCLTSQEANQAAREGILRVLPQAEVTIVDVSDGGEGFLSSMATTGQWQHVTVTAHDPLLRPVQATYLMRRDEALIESAQASGLTLLQPQERDPLHASSYGTGELIADALRRGARHLTIGLGGTATSDCGQGMLKALSDTFGSLAHIPQVDVTLATDVSNPLCGPQGAARMFAPQKGATPDMVEQLEREATSFARANAARMGQDCSPLPGAGAAGGMGYALMQFLGARCRSGAEVVFEAARIDEKIRRADLIVTGEGRADRQTLMGKLPFAVLQKALRHNVPVWLLAGQVDDNDQLLQAGFRRVQSINPPTLTLTEAMKKDVALQRIRQTIEALHHSSHVREGRNLTKTRRTMPTRNG